MSGGTVIQGCFPRGLPRNGATQMSAGAIQLAPARAAFPRKMGQPLAPAVLQKMESLFGTRLHDVRIHTGPHVAELGAQAFTQGNDIHFAPGQYNPSTLQGEQMLARQLTHVVQQRTGRVRNPFGSGVAVVNDPLLQAEADRTGQRIRQMIAAPRATRSQPQSANPRAVQRKQPGGAVVQRGWWGALTGAISGTALGFATAGPAGMIGGLIGGAVLGHYGEELRNMPPNPHQGTLWNLPEDQWWRLFIDPQHHAAAAMLADPALYYDQDQSPGYRASMVGAYRSELLHSGGRIGRPITYREYVRLHDRVTSGLPLHQQDHDHVRRPSSIDEWPATNFPIGGRGRPAADILGEQLNGIPLLGVSYRNDAHPPLPGSCICYFDEFNRRIVVHYTIAAGQQHVNAALTRYYQERAVAATNQAKLEAIVRVIRALHVIHAFRDANGRLHIMLMLNRFLTEEGFSPVILRNNPEMFGGSYAIAELVQEVLNGMTDFRARVRGTNGWFSNLQ